MLAVKSSEKPNPSLDINYRYNVNFDKVTFDSLINNFRAETPSKTPEQSSYTKEMNDQRYSGRAEDPYKSQNQPEKINKNDEKNYHDGYEQVNERPVESESNEYANAAGDNRRNEVEQEQYTDNTEQANGSGTVAADKNTELPDETELNKDNGINAGAFLYAMSHSFNDGLTDESETVQAVVKEDTSGNSTDGGKKTGALLFNMANGLAEETKTAAAEGTAQTDNVVKAENGLKAGILLKDLMQSKGPVEEPILTGVLFP